MIKSVEPRPISSSPLTHESFDSWRRSVESSGIHPIVTIAGSRGKTTVSRLLDSIFSKSGLRTAIRTDASVEVRGKRQRGEITPWMRAREELERGTLDIGVEEIDWLSVNTVGIGALSRPVVAITNVCANRDACLIQEDAHRAMAALPVLFEATHSAGAIVINSDDYELAREEFHHDRAAIVVGIHRDSPGVRGHLDAGGSAGWIEDGWLTVGSRERAERVVREAELSFAMQGLAAFQIHNALMSCAVASYLGFSGESMRRGLLEFEPARGPVVESFQAIEKNGIAIVVDRPNPSWFLRAIVRALRDLRPNRVVAVFGRLPGIPRSDLPEVGRLLGRVCSTFVVHDADADPEQIASVRRGAAMNDLPPVIYHTKSEGKALLRAFSATKPGDAVLVLSERPGTLARSIERRVKMISSDDPSDREVA